MREVIRCGSCRLNQYLADKCRRCHKRLAPEELPVAPDIFVAEEPKQSTFGARFKELRQMRGLSQDRLCLKSGNVRSYINKIENDKLVPFLHNALKLADALDVHPLFLVEPDELVAWASAAMRRMSPGQRSQTVRWTEKRLR